MGLAHPISIFHFHFSFFLQIGGIKRFRKQLAHGDDFGFALQIREDHRHVPAKFPDQLAAGTAGRRKRIRVRHHGDGVEAALSFADRFENGDAFSANGEAVRGVFDVAASKILPEAARRAAPTRKLEYGACAFSRACFAAEIKMSFSPTLSPPGTHWRVQEMTSAIRGSKAFSNPMNCPFTRSAVSSTSL